MTCPEGEVWLVERKECVSREDYSDCDEDESTCELCRRDDMYWTGEACAPCPEWFPNFDTEQKKCMPKCPDDTPYFHNNKCISCD